MVLVEEAGEVFTSPANPDIDVRAEDFRNANQGFE